MQAYHYEYIPEVDLVVVVLVAARSSVDGLRIWQLVRRDGVGWRPSLPARDPLWMCCVRWPRGGGLRLSGRQADDAVGADLFGGCEV